MIFNFFRTTLMIWILFILTGCAQNMRLSEHFWHDKQQKIAVVSTQAPVPQVYETGNQGLIDIAINKSQNRPLNYYLKRMDLTWYRMLPRDFVRELEKRHIRAKSYPGWIAQGTMQSMDISRLAQQTQSDKILLIDLWVVGAKRNYHGFIPLGGPVAYCRVKSKLVDARTKKILWRHESEISEPIEAPWNQPPHFSNFSRALNKMERVVRQELLDSFFLAN